jgi:hypothetical protein
MNAAQKPRLGHDRSRVDNGFMCGRFTRYRPVDVFAEMVGVDADFRLAPSYNILPGQALSPAPIAARTACGPNLPG